MLELEDKTGEWKSFNINKDQVMENNVRGHGFMSLGAQV